MSIKIELVELYGCKDIGELMHSIDCMKKMDFSDDEINEVLERSKKREGKIEDEQMRIQALSQEPTDTWSIKDVADTFKKHGLIREQEPCDDAISREAVLLFIEKVKVSGIVNYGSLLDIATEVRNLPPVTQKTGKWIYRREDKYSCSKCGTTTSVDEAGIDEKPMYKFCPYCGAEMEGEE